MCGCIVSDSRSASTIVSGSEISSSSYYENSIASMEDMTLQRGMVEMKVKLKIPTKIKLAYKEQNSDQR